MESKLYLAKPLTKAEVEVLGYLRQGYNNEAIAKYCFLSIGTVHNQINSMYGKIISASDELDFEYMNMRVLVATRKLVFRAGKNEW